MPSQLASTYSGVELPPAADRALAMLARRPLSLGVRQQTETEWRARCPSHSRCRERRQRSTSDIWSRRSSHAGRRTSWTRQERVLDVACGTGVVTRLLAERVGVGGRVAGLDLNPTMLATARVVAGRANVEWFEGNAMNMALPDAAFDAVVYQQGLQFIPDKLAALREMRRVLVPGGRLALSVWRSVDQAPGYRVLQVALGRRLGPEKAALPPFGLPDGQVIRAIVASAGF
jgi:SAM-dependent methyltransferase